MKVPYRYPGSTNTQLVDIYTRLAFDRIIFLDDAINDGLANFIVSMMLYLDSDDPTKPIYLYINSPGDDVMPGMMASMAAGLSIYDTMQHIKAPIHTICLGQSAGSSTLLLAAGTKGFRLSLPHSTIVLNPFYVGGRGQATDIQIMAKKVLADRDTIFGILSDLTGQSTEKLAKDSERRLYLDPHEAQAYGLVDRVLERSPLPNALAAAAT
ncbi:MAG: ATP-dependent Clp protease proteolytic subunit [Kaiparowitsia implicata GSE-PSE-MK54-09C]|jgi:ATP-dependent Clp protease protease subunit|nr:ATP-dependent Clp protease proteolytic subunit [Kaiparowitsia implicata GSE-PSE-MK54-09C]